MKKISLVLCACAVAMAGLLASCSNGPEELVFNTVEDTWETNILYDVTGTIKKVEKSGVTDSITTREYVETVTSGYTTLSWISKTPDISDVVEYKFWDFDLRVKRVDTVTPSSGEGTTTTYSETSDSFWWPGVWSRATYYDGSTLGFKKIGNTYYTRIQDMSWQWQDTTVTLSADPATSDSFTLTFNFTDDSNNVDSDDDGTVDDYNQTTWSCSLTFTKKAAN